MTRSSPQERLVELVLTIEALVTDNKLFKSEIIKSPSEKIKQNIREPNLKIRTSFCGKSFFC
mgnify:CR=1 FL=1